MNTDTHIAFTKMNGLGNDFVIIDARVTPLALTRAQVQRLAARSHATTTGCDQLLVLHPPRTHGDVFMQIFNQDGSEVEACGNGTRAVAAYLARQDGQSDVQIDTLGGLLSAHTEAVNTGDKNASYIPSVKMPLPVFGWADIPLSQAHDNTAAISLAADLPPAFMVNVGNPHAVMFVDAVAGAPAAFAGQRGASLENHGLFPQGANINFATRVAPTILRLDTWERGAGLTQACGTGACAAAIAAIATHLVEGPHVDVRPPANRGDTAQDVIRITYRPNQELIMSGPVRFEFDGLADLESHMGDAT
ncbi:diaminopimelate epimerase [Alphaproteobacteria bacterium]|nr:diaminopimelate epimerase [Alphaproteobacteria bacterium]